MERSYKPNAQEFYYYILPADWRLLAAFDHSSTQRNVVRIRSRSEGELALPLVVIEVGFAVLPFQVVFINVTVYRGRIGVHLWHSVRR